MSCHDAFGTGSCHSCVDDARVKGKKVVHPPRPILVYVEVDRVTTGPEVEEGLVVCTVVAAIGRKKHGDSKGTRRAHGYYRREQQEGGLKGHPDPSLAIINSVSTQRHVEFREL